MSIGFEPPVELRFVPAETFAAVDEPGATPLARSSTDGGAVVPAAGLVMIYGDGGAGKTTLELDLVFALAGGRAWLDLVGADRPLRVSVIEAEGPRQEFRVKFRAKLAHHGELGGRVAVLEEPWADFSFASDTHRRGLALHITEHTTDLLVVGPTVSVGSFPNGGTPDEISRFEQHTHDLRALVREGDGRSFAILLLHHENRAGQISGAWERLPDTLIHVTGQGNGRTRLYWQKVRHSSALHQTSTHLLWTDGASYALETRPEVSEDSIAGELVAAVQENGGASWTAIRDLRDDQGEKRVRGKAVDIARVRDRLLGDGTLVNTAAREGSFTLWHHTDPACPRSHAGTASERLTYPAPASEVEADPFPVPAYIGNGRNGNGTNEPESLWHDDGRTADELDALAVSLTANEGDRP